jgi:transcriptional regulator with XRE-family HTH domain
MLLKRIIVISIIGVKPMNIHNKNFLREIGFRLQEQRHSLKLTQQELADRCQLHRTFIGSVERGERNISVLNLRRIAKVLRISLAHLFEGLT